MPKERHERYDGYHHEKITLVIDALVWALGTCQCRDQWFLHRPISDALKIYCQLAAFYCNDGQDRWSTDLVDYVIRHPAHWRVIKELLEHPEYAPVDWKTYQPPS